MLHTPLQLGRLQLPNRVIQGPLAGYSCAPFRVVSHVYGTPAYCCTEMISAHDLIRRQTPLKRYVWRDPREPLLCYQIAGQDPEIVARATALLSTYNADIIDLNCGCPVKKIRRKGTGSALLRDPEALYQLVKCMRDNTDAVVTVKIRVGEPHFDSDDRAVAEAIAQAGADALVVHGRHWQERYDVPCRMTAIAAIVQHSSIPVIANGDVNDYSSAEQLQKTTGAAAIMVGRAGVGDPWLLQRVRGELVQEPSRDDAARVFIEHVNGLRELDGERLAVLQARKLAKYYGAYCRDRLAFTIAMQEVTVWPDMLALVEHWFSG